MNAPTASTSTQNPMPATVGSSAAACVFASFDTQYADYCYRAPHVGDGEVMDYAAWKSVRARWAELDAQYEAEIEPLYAGRSGYGLTFEQKQRQSYLLREMGWYETLLAY